MNEWLKSDWRVKPRVQMPEYTDATALAKVEQRLSNYPPLGERGLGFSKYNNFKLNKNDLKIKPIIIHMIENIYAYKNLEKIMNYKNLIDGFFIGPVDLSLSMNDMLKFSTKHKKAINIIKQKCQVEQLHHKN